MPLPPGAVIRGDQSLIIGSGDNWVGRVVLDVGRDFDAAYRFFLEAYPAQGWTVVSSVRGKNSFRGHDAPRAHGNTGNGGRGHVGGEHRVYHHGASQCPCCGA